MDEKKKNGIIEIRDFFSCEGRPVTVQEYRDFWASLKSEEEKDVYRHADLSAA